MSEIKNITTSVYGKQEVFRMLALAHATGLPLLLVGPPGVAKTRCVLDYMKNEFKGNPKEFNDSVFILETDEGTRASEVKGTVDMESLVTHRTYKLNSPITKAKIIMINEVDKASSSLRNSFLGVMNEKFLFNGKEKVPTPWELFVATCNQIPDDEKDSPFWDRFPLKIEVNRISAGDLQKYFDLGGKSYSTTIKIKYPEKADIDAINIPADKMNKFLEVCYKSCTDRTLSYVPFMAKNIMFIYNCSLDKALVKVAELVASSKEARELDRVICSIEKKEILDQIDLLGMMSDSIQLNETLERIERLVNKHTQNNKIDKGDVEEVQHIINLVLEQHPAYNDDEKLKKLADDGDEYEDPHGMNF